MHNTCTACGLGFGGIAAFDKHRTGNFTQGFTQLERRCKTEAEMLDAGMVRKQNGLWSADATVWAGVPTLDARAIEGE